MWLLLFSARKEELGMVQPAPEHDQIQAEVIAGRFFDEGTK